MESAFHRNLLIVALMVSPFIAATCLISADPHYDFSSVMAFAVLLVSLALGATGVWLLPTGRWTRAAALIVYLPATVAAVFFWSLVLACGAYDVCV